MSVILKHECPRRDRISDNDAEKSMKHGPAYDGTPFFFEEYGCWAIGNSEYASPVWHCPYCGAELRPFKGEHCAHEIEVHDGVKVCRKCLTTPCEHDFQGGNRGFQLKNCAGGAENQS